MDQPWLYRPAWSSQRSAIEKRAGQPALVSSSAVRPRREMPFSQKCFIRSSCARTMTSDPDLEAKTRFSPRSILDDSFLGEGVALWRGVVGSCPGCPDGGEGVEGVAPCTFSPAFPGKRVEDPCIDWTLPGPWFLLDDSSGPWTPLSCSRFLSLS